jgi:hypothetical protein
MATTQITIDASVDITSPANQAPVFTPTLTVTGGAFALKTTQNEGAEPVETPLQIVKVEVRLGAGSFVPAQPTGPGGSFTSWSLTTATPAGPPLLEITARMTFKAGATTSDTRTDAVTVKLDTTGPAITVDQPLPLHQVALPTDASDAQVALPVAGTVSDGESGVAQVTVAVTGATPVTATRSGNGFSATVTVRPPAGRQTVTVEARDNRGNVTTHAVPIDVAAPFTAPDPGNALGAAAYLTDLLLFAERRVAGSQATASALNAAFSQRFAAAAAAGNARVATAAVPHARVAVEVLRDYLKRRVTLSGAPLEQGKAADRRFVRTAYRAVLRAFGMSPEELRAARTSDEAREALAARLGLDALTISDLDALALDPDTITPLLLEETYGVVDTTRNPYTPPTRPVPLLLELQLTHLHNRWQREDAAAGVPIVDPDLVTPGDIPLAGPAGTLRSARRAQVDGELAARSGQIATALAATGATHAAVFTSAVEGVLGAGAVGKLDELVAEEQTGVDIGPGVAALNLDLAAFRRLVAIRALAIEGAVREGEWADVAAIAVAVRKRRDFHPTWRDQEAGLWLGLEHLHVATPAVALDSLPPWLTTPAARVAWESTVRAREAEERTLREAFAAAVQSADIAALPRLRDDLLAVVGAARPASAAPPGPFAPDVAADRLTRELLFDFSTSGTALTSRLDQALESLQGVLFAVRAKRLKSAFPVLGTNAATGEAGWTLTQANGYTDAAFDEEWRFMGEHGTWRAAMAAFLWPENVLQPTLRRTPTAANQLTAVFTTASFRSLAERVRGDLALTPARARAEAKKYLTDLRAEFPVTANPTLPAAMRDDAKLQITELLTDAQLAHRRDVLLATTAVAGQSGTVGQDYALFAPSGTVNATFRDTRVWLAEAFFFVPMLLAQQLEKSGQHLAALDWVRTVYAYDLPRAGRKIYRGLRLEEPAAGSAQPVVVRSPDWLLGNGMQPHDVVANRPNAHTRATLLTLVRLLLTFADTEFTRETRESLPRARQLYEAARDLLDASQPEFTPQLDGANTPLAPNPVLDAGRERATGGLRKLRSGLNPLGLERAISHRPTPYRFATLIERAQRLVGTAQQMEERFLAALEKADAEAYDLLKARQDITLAQATVELQDLRVGEAQAGVEVTELQRGSAAIQRDQAQVLLDRATGVGEKAAVVAAGVRAAIAVASVIPGVGAVPGAFFNGLGGLSPGNGVAVANAVGIPGAIGAITSFLGAASSFERQRDDLTVRLRLADKDLAIAEQQIAIAQLRVGVVEQERRISETQLDNAEATLEFLASKFTNAELFEWMAGVLGGVYRYFLLQATVIARLAERQLAFERQEVQPQLIRADYWEPPANGAGPAGPDRRGLTGAAQLLRDLTQLEQYAFATDQRRLQLSKTLSLAAIDPVAFQRFRDTGVLTFATPTELFDRDHPGHYVRLIKRVRTSVVALTAPAQGIRATLASAGTSRVVVENDLGFSTVTVAHGPDEVALSSPANATGVFELDAQTELRGPFEGFGVDTLWELRMPKAANPIDFGTVSDVLFTIDYTALDSAVLRDRVIRALDPRVSTDRAFSLRHDFPDQWFDLHNPDQTATPMRVRFRTGRADLPPNLDEPAIDHLLVYAAGADGTAVELNVDELKFTSAGAGEVRTSSAAATTVDGIVSTRRGNGAPWRGLRDAAPDGEWELALDDTPELRELFAREQIADLLFVLTVRGRTPPWP